MPKHGRRTFEAAAAASSSGDPASRVVARRGRVCATPGCGREYARTRHRNCCSMCTVGAHTARCEADFAKFSCRLSLAMRREQRGALTPCSTPMCTRVAGLGHHTCCGPCADTGGGDHTTHCSHRQNYLMMQHTPAAMTTTSGVTADDQSAVAMEMTLREPATSTDSGAGGASKIVTIVVSDSESEKGELAYFSGSRTAAKAACHDFDEMD